MFDEQNEYLNNYEVTWIDFTSTKVSNYLDFLFGISDLERQNFTREFQIAGFAGNDKILKPDVSGYELEAEKLTTIQAYQSKGFQIFDITPGNLGLDNYSCSIRPSWLFDGVNFTPDHDAYLTTNFRSVDVSSPGNFLKIEFIGEINNFSNMLANERFTSTSAQVRERANIKYQSVFDDSPAPKGLDILRRNSTLGPIPQDVYHYDNYARAVVWVSFNSTDQKPHIVRDGDIFNTYFDTITIHCNVGAPKIRITIGNNSSIDSSSDDAEINSQLHLTGASRLIKKMDCVLQPFCITDATATGQLIQGRDFLTLPSGTRITRDIVYPTGDYINGNQDYLTLGYSVFWITKLRFRFTSSVVLNETNYITAKFIIISGIPGVDPYYYSKIVTSMSPSINGKVSETIDLEFSQPLRVVLPPQAGFILEIIGVNLPSTIVYVPIYEIYGYSLGGIIPLYNGVGVFTNLSTTKFVTDATFLDDFTPQYNKNTF